MNPSHEFFGAFSDDFWHHFGHGDPPSDGARRAIAHPANHTTTPVDSKFSQCWCGFCRIYDFSAKFPNMTFESKYNLGEPWSWQMISNALSGAPGAQECNFRHGFARRVTINCKTHRLNEVHPEVHPAMGRCASPGRFLAAAKKT